MYINEGFDFIKIMLSLTKSFPDVYDVYENGGGPYHPAPGEDKSLSKVWLKRHKLNYTLYFGFSNINQFLEWTIDNTVRQEMEKAGMVLRVFECQEEDVTRGTKQIMFTKSRALPYAEFSVLSFS